MVNIPQGKDWKPFHGPYQVLSVTPTNVEVRLVDSPTIFVNLNRVQLCYSEQRDDTWTGPIKRRKRRRKSRDSDSGKRPEPRRSGPVTSSMKTGGVLI